MAPLSGIWLPTPLPRLHYGPNCVSQHLLSALPTPTSKAFIITGQSLSKTPLLPNLEKLLDKHHAGTISCIRQHTPVSDIDHTAEQILPQKGNIDTLISLGGGSVIDATKIISHRYHEAHNVWLTHITIPTTLSAAECTPGGGYTSNGTKKAIIDAGMGVSSIFYDPGYKKYTPVDLWLRTGMRALDHAVECMYNPIASEIPWKVLALWAAAELWEGLPQAKTHPVDEEVTVRLMLAAYASSGLKGAGIRGMGLSHRLGHALGAPYGIPHGTTSCLTLGKVVLLKAREKNCAEHIARLAPCFGGVRTGDDTADAMFVGERILKLVRELELDGKLGDWGVGTEEKSVIVKRAMGDDVRVEEMEKLVDELF
ncbi:hypothetical protein EYZ11_003824 [Aspergillus tanneri]|uniref:Uncharacterized protein n=1 Tax=Aspergillus tanneri TaxID=1220188 RepID=A0A4S3JPI1_9EURO|nr:uncharacterized protein ATNIH1004_003527 [Aspergillus tanneri]KAA8650838.1 hypothetical protein ATNIH1004_003527 [Aspergillus tanneri]THC96718.1 hypothetical protein EYZ11_003824 [Aspergillus tanneri]